MSKALELLPPGLVDRSLAEAVEFTRLVLPLLRQACEYVAREVMLLPPGAARHRESELQSAPAIVRMRMHQLVSGHNMKCLGDGGKPLRRKHIRNSAVCLLLGEQEFRMLKASKAFPTVPSGRYQQALIDQEHYRKLISESQLFPDQEVPLLNALIYYYFTNLQFKGAYVVIPNGFVNNKVNIVKQERVEAYSANDLEDLARWESTGFVSVLNDREAMIFSEGAVDGAAEFDPYAEVEPETREASGSVLGYEEVDGGVLGTEKAEPEK